MHTEASSSQRIRTCTCCTPSNIFVTALNRDIALEIIQSDQWKSALRNTSKSPLGKITTPLRKLIKKMPGEFFSVSVTCIFVVHVNTDVAEQVFNRCTLSNETKDGKIRHDSKDYNITFDYEFIEDFQDAKGDFCSNLFTRYDNDELRPKFKLKDERRGGGN